MQQLVEAQHPVKQAAQIDTGTHTSLHDQESAIQHKNEQLLQMGKGKEALGGVLDAAVKQVLRAEAAEVKLRRQAALSKGASVASVYKNLRFVRVRVRARCGPRVCAHGGCLQIQSARRRRRWLYRRWLHIVRAWNTMDVSVSLPMLRQKFRRAACLC